MEAARDPGGAGQKVELFYAGFEHEFALSLKKTMPDFLDIFLCNKIPIVFNQ